MTDTITKEHRSWNMSRIKGKNTKPELIVRSMLHSLGYRFRLNRNDLPGRPDIVLPKYKTVIFVHGCFWHQHKNCKRSSIPKSNQKYWLPKLKKNVTRNKHSIEALKKAGWKVLIIWECETKELDLLKEKTNQIIKKDRI